MIATDLASDFATVAEAVLVDARSAGWQDGFNDGDWVTARDGGWLDVLRPEKDGGLGLGLPELGAIFRVAGRHLFAAPLLEHAVVVPLVEAVGVETQGLVAVVDGETRVRFADRAETVVEVRADADAVAVFPVERVSIRPCASLVPSMTFAEVLLGNARPSEVVAIDVEALRASQRLMIACELTGVAERALAFAVEYAKQREQFERPIGSFQAIQHLLAEMARLQHGLNTLCKSAVTASPYKLPVAGRIAKAAAGTAARAIVEGALQVHGGIAFTMEHPLHRYYKHALALEPMLGLPSRLAAELGALVLSPSADPWPSW